MNLPLLIKAVNDNCSSERVIDTLRAKTIGENTKYFQEIGELHFFSPLIILLHKATLY